MQTLQMLAKIVSGGFCGACSIIIGNEIGRGDLNRVNRYCKKFHLTALIVGITSGIVVYSMINPMLDNLFDKRHRGWKMAASALQINRR